MYIHIIVALFRSFMQRIDWTQKPIRSRGGDAADRTIRRHQQQPQHPTVISPGIVLCERRPAWSRNRIDAIAPTRRAGQTCVRIELRGARECVEN